MEEVTKELLPTLQLFLPGFLTTIVFYWFASVPKPPQFERVLQALICTPIIKFLVEQLESTLYEIGELYSVGVWTKSTELGFSIALPIAIGLSLACLCNRDLIYKIARKIGITKKASIDDTTHIFSSRPDHVVVFEFIDGRRLLGYIRSFPNDCTAGVFLVDNPHWMAGKTPTPYAGIESILINATDVKWIEFLEE
ncbi:hypothetical protein N5D48_05115 [Pseudomonas sp. GD03858]|uniref:hypothetical protein n=1 Tax=unclassified Pseudomonas TaxID=196821 RepID=UPI002446979B|nr:MULTISPECIES: hypothetical protein [unclassified Pseudomonas]MDH0646227.1 hypothetical protein [Pseudomonas sp. GD03867]MDH0661774.1 hypothetical protein [Pseudomonas sp. GD03858]